MDISYCIIFSTFIYFSPSTNVSFTDKLCQKISQTLKILLKNSKTHCYSNITLVWCGIGVKADCLKNLGL